MQRVSHSLGMGEQAAVFDLLGRQAPSLQLFARRGMMAFRYEQPWFRRHHLLQIDLPHVFPPRHLQVALRQDGGASRLLTAQIPEFNALVESDPPAAFADLGAAKAYAEAADAWTTESQLGELLIASFDEVPLYPKLDDLEEVAVGVLRTELGPYIEAPVIERRDDGYRLTKWVVENRRLIRREVDVDPIGRIARDDVSYDDNLPCPPGKIWAERDGRTVPVG